ncbi:MAG: hypothetical protein PF630_10625 [Gammaproteobacteria bacterium]|jgi:hypothetical protein|nr:hypothetical protein [Gammaproteobacteria bacterium]
MLKLTLNGIDGQHLWGFLTALGALSMLDEHARVETLEAPRLSFQEDCTAVIHSPVEKEQLAAVLLKRLQALQPYLENELAIVKKPSDFTRENYNNITQESNLGSLDFLAGLACVIGDHTFESTLCAANGASHQNLIQSMRDVLNLVEKEHVQLAMFETWQKSYRVPPDKRKQLKLGSRKPTLRLDPADERLYALRFSNPTTTDDFRTELGAQALAIPAFALLPVVPQKQPVTVASKRKRERVTFSWPIWSNPATLLTTRSLLWEGVNHPKFQRARGVLAAFSADRVAGSKGKLSFAPSQGIW